MSALSSACDVSRPTLGWAGEPGYSAATHEGAAARKKTQNAATGQNTSSTWQAARQASSKP